MGAMHRNQYDAHFGHEDLTQAYSGWLFALFTQELPWGVFVVDSEANEALVGAVVDQQTAVALAEALGHAPRHIRIRRLR